MRFKKFEKPHKNAKFQAKRAVMKQDETVKTQILSEGSEAADCDGACYGGKPRGKRWRRDGSFLCDDEL